MALSGTAATGALMTTSSSGTPLLKAPVGRQRQKLAEHGAFDQGVQDLRRFPQAAGAIAFERRQLLAPDAPIESRRDGTPVGELRLVVDPLPELGAGDLGRGHIFHEVEDRGRSVAGEPRVPVL